MRKYKLGVVVFLIIFLVLQALVVVAGEPDDLIESAISELEAAQNALENANQEEAYSLLNTAKAQITKVTLPMMPSNSNGKLMTDEFLIKPAKDFLEFEKREYNNNYFVSVDISIENLTDKELPVMWDWYIIDPEGVQRSSSVYTASKALAGATAIQSCRIRIKESRFTFGPYTLIMEPEGTNKIFKLKFELTEELLN